MESNERFSIARVKRIIKECWNPNKEEQEYIDRLDPWDMEAICINKVISDLGKLKL